jgi:hypothetical protein
MNDNGDREAEVVARRIESTTDSAIAGIHEALGQLGLQPPGPVFDETAKRVLESAYRSIQRTMRIPVVEHSPWGLYGGAEYAVSTHLFEALAPSLPAEVSIKRVLAMQSAVHCAVLESIGAFLGGMKSPARAEPGRRKRARQRTPVENGRGAKARGPRRRNQKPK